MTGNHAHAAGMRANLDYESRDCKCLSPPEGKVPPPVAGGMHRGPVDREDPQGMIQRVQRRMITSTSMVSTTQAVVPAWNQSFFPWPGFGLPGGDGHQGAKAPDPDRRVFRVQMLYLQQAARFGFIRFCRPRACIHEGQAELQVAGFVGLQFEVVRIVHALLNGDCSPVFGDEVVQLIEQFADALAVHVRRWDGSGALSARGFAAYFHKFVGLNFISAAGRFCWYPSSIACNRFSASSAKS